MAPLPMKPMPAIRPSTIRAVASGDVASSRSVVWKKPQLAAATRAKVRKPALRSARSRSHPIGSASA